MSTHVKTLKSARIKASFLWFAVLQAITAAAAWAITSGGQILRGFLLGSITLTMLVQLLLVSFEAGLTAMIIFEPFRAILRRMQYLIVPYSTYEPIHLMTPVVTFFAFILILNRQKLEIFFASRMAKGVTFLAIICFLQIFNPLQGGLFVGLSGGMFILVPMAWFYFGQNAVPEFFPRVMRMIVILGMITSFYGVYQIIFGYPAFEQYWIENTDHYESIAVYNVTRALATYSNAEEWGRYTQIGSLIAFGLCLSKSEAEKRPFWFFSAIVLCIMLALSGQRSSIFGLFLGLTVLFLTGAKTLSSAFARISLLGAAAVLFLTLSTSLAEDDIRALDDSQGVNTMISHSTKGTLDPTSEGSLSARFETWNHLVTVVLPSNPVGSGLGAGSLSATRSEEREKPPIDNHFLTMAVSAGVPAALLLIWILFYAFKICIKRWRESETDSVEFSNLRIAMALLASFILNNFFGTSFVIYTVAPIGWLLLGWIDSINAEDKSENSETHMRKYA
jgi:hypothetical protein